MEIKKEKSKLNIRKPNFVDQYHGAKDNVKFILEDKNCKRTEIKR